jgi:hypothetical protein
VAEKRLGVETGQFFFTDRERDDRNVLRGNLLVAQFLVEWNVGVAINVEMTAVFLPGAELDGGDTDCQSACPKRRR